jgi:hypothetical protein
MTRKERIERMLLELRYEVEIGMMQGDIDETLHRQHASLFGHNEPRLTVVKK